MDQIFESHFGGSQSNNGGETDAYCTKCRTDTQHIILESYGNEIRRVQCAVCGDAHAFKPPRGSEDDSPEPVAKRQVRKLPWRDGIRSYDGTQAVRYSPHVDLHMHQVVVHPTFGLGFVSELVGEQKVELTFRDDVTRVLVYGRGATDEQRKGESVPIEEVQQLIRLEMGPSPEEIAAERERKRQQE